MSFLRVACADSKYIRGMELGNESAPDLTVLPLEEAFTRTWTTDAHFVTYEIPGCEAWPRINKGALATLRARGVTPMTSIIAHDFDTVPHEPWTADGIAAFESLVNGLPAPFCNYSLLYGTTKGARFIYTLDRPIPVEEGEAIHRALVRDAAEVGLRLDAACSDWTRLFRLPFVVRDGVPTWEDSSPRLRWQSGRVLAVDALPRLWSRALAAPLPDECPSAERVEELLTRISEKGSRVPNKWKKEAEKRLFGCESYPCLFEGAPLAPEGSRNDTLTSFVGQVVALLFSLPGTTPAHVYALFHAPVATLVPDRSTPDWHRVLWDLVKRLWRAELGKAEAQEAERRALVAAEEAAQARTADTLAGVIDGMRRWCSHPALASEQARQWASEHLIAHSRFGAFVMTPLGHYDGLGVQPPGLINRIRDLGMHNVIETIEVTDQGVKDRTAQTLLNRHGTSVAAIEYRVGVEHPHIERIGTEDAVFVARTFARRADITPEYSEAVDGWLRQLGGAHYADLCQWLGKALAFEEGPIAALSLIGSPGAGKKLVAVGLSEAITTLQLATGTDLTGAFNSRLLESPFLWINEGWPQGIRQFNPADKFRELVAGDPIEINRKYMPPVRFYNNVRVILTGNTFDILKELAKGRDLTAHDREAITQRLFHLKVTDDAVNWLAERGGVNFTRGWVGGYGPSDWTVARHFLWLYSKRAVDAQGRTQVEGRFLMGGRNTEEVMQELRTEGKTAPIVVETLLTMLAMRAGRRMDGLAVIAGRVYVLSSQVLSFFRDVLWAKSRADLTAKSVGNALKGLCKSQEIRTLPGKETLGKQRWNELDLELLLAVARRDGFACPPLESLVEGAPVIEIRGNDERAGEQRTAQ